MFNSVPFTLTNLVALVLLIVAVVMQVMEMQLFEMPPFK